MFIQHFNIHRKISVDDIFKYFEYFCQRIGFHISSKLSRRQWNVKAYIKEKQEASSKKKISDEEYQIIVGIFGFQYYSRGS